MAPSCIGVQHLYVQFTPWGDGVGGCGEGGGCPVELGRSLAGGREVVENFLVTGLRVRGERGMVMGGMVV